MKAKTNLPVFRSCLLCLGLWLQAGTLAAQTNSFIYKYDNSGNRVKRELPPPPATKSAAIPDIVVSEVELDTVATTPTDPWSQKQGSEPFRSKVYPNPTDGQLTVELLDLKDGERGQIRIYSLAGKLVLQQNSVQTAQTLDFTNNPSGYYILHVTVEGKKLTKTIVKR